MTQQQSTQVCEISKTTACAKVDELAMLVRRLVQSLRKAAPDNDLADQALDYLKRYGMGGTILRDVPANAPRDVPAGMKPSKAPEAIGTSTSASAPENVPALLAGVSAPAVATVERYEIPGGMRAALSDVIAYLRSHSRRDLVRLMQELYDAISPWDCGECSDVPDALMPARQDADYLLSISRNHRWPMLMRAHIKSAARAATQATEAPAADALDDSALLDAMEQMRIAVVPEYEGPWDAEVYNDDGKPKHLGSGSTPREAIRAAIAAQAQEAQR